MVLLNILFDTNGNFQWAGVAAIVSFLAFCSTIVSMIFTQHQAKKNRKSSTLVRIRLEELKELREEVISSISLIDAFIEEKNSDVSGNKNILPTDSINVKLSEKLSKIQSILYRRTLHGASFQVEVSACQIKLNMVEDTLGLVEIKIELDQAINKYSVIEWNEIEKSI